MWSASKKHPNTREGSTPPHHIHVPAKPILLEVAMAAHSKSQTPDASSPCTEMHVYGSRPFPYNYQNAIPKYHVVTKEQKCAAKSSKDLGLRIGFGPFAGRFNSCLLVFLPALCDIVGKWVVRVRGAEERLDGEEDGADLEGWRPVAWMLSVLIQHTQSCQYTYS